MVLPCHPSILPRARVAFSAVTRLPSPHPLCPMFIITTFPRAILPSALSLLPILAPPWPMSYQFRNGRHYLCHPPHLRAN